MDADTRPFDRPLHAAVRTALADTPVVCLLGPRQAGKTTLARQFEPAYGYISLDDPATLAFAESDPAGFVAALPDPVILGACRTLVGPSANPPTWSIFPPILGP